MFCGKCGTHNDDTAFVCTGCGAPIENSSPTPEKPGFKLDNRKIGIIAIAAIAVIVIVAAIFLFSGMFSTNNSTTSKRTYEATVKELFKAVEKADAKALLKLIPDDVISEALKDADMTKKEFTEEIQDSLDDMTESVEYYYGDDWKISYKIEDTEKIDEDDLEDLQDMYDDNFNVKVKDAMIVELEVTFKFEDNKMSNNMELTLIKIGNSWYLDMESMGSLF